MHEVTGSIPVVSTKETNPDFFEVGFLHLYEKNEGEQTMDIPAFGEHNFVRNRENKNAEAILIFDADEGAFERYVAYFESHGFAVKNQRHGDLRDYGDFFDGSDGIFMNYFREIRELSIVFEKNCRYFFYEDRTLPARVSPQITQVMLEDFGMSYAIRLSDGRFIVIDGGDNFAPNRERLFQCLTDGSNGNKPVIAAWIMTHPHSDHFHCFLGFMDCYGDQVTVEKFLLNFPEADDLEHYPELTFDDARFPYDTSSVATIPQMYDRIRHTQAPVYMPHTGQTYRIGDASCEILASLGETLHVSKDVNTSSLIIRMELAGQVILWSTDAYFGPLNLVQKYGKELKADLLQIPHHGFGGGSSDAFVEAYRLIDPEVCLLPLSDYNAFTLICPYIPSTRYLMAQLHVREVITGTPQRTISLPYTPPLGAEKTLENRRLSGLENCGTKTWIFSDLSTACQEDFCFTLLNMTAAKAEVFIDLFFEESAQNVRFIKTEVKSTRMRKIRLNGDEVDGDALYFNWLSLQKQGIPQNALFAVRFMSNVPIVVTHRTHRASYCAPMRET